MANTLALPHIFEIAFDALTAAVGGLVILLALRVAPALTLSAHRLALRISIIAAVLIIGAQMAEVWADFSRLSTHDRGRRRRRRRADRRMFCRFSLAPDGPSRESGNLLLAEGGQRGSPDRLGQSILLPPGGGAADRALQEKRSALACAVLDVDNFKSYNDRYGHGSGDEALRCVGRVLRESTQADDVVARYGGEEFVVLMGGNIEDVIEVAERVRHGVEHESVTENETPLGSSVTVSVGVVALTEDVSSLEQLVERADDELYRAKRAGKNRVAAAGRR